MAAPADTQRPAPPEPADGLMDPGLRRRLREGAVVRVVQQIAARAYAWGTEHVGTVIAYEQRQTGSWYAHSRGDKLWLDRLVVRKSDGEIFTFNLDEYTHIDVLEDGPPPRVNGSAAPDVDASGQPV